jgi:hypothetical protein
MNPNKTQSEIESAFASPKQTLCRGSILVPAEPIDLEAVTKTAIESDDDEDDYYNLGGDIVFEKAGWEISSLFSFEWQSLGPMVWECYLNLVCIGNGRALACRRQDADPQWQSIALIKRSTDSAVMGRFFSAMIRENGAAFGVELFGSLPSTTHNHVEELVSEETVRQAYWDWLRWADKVFDVDWEGLAEEVSVRPRSPIFYPLELLGKLGSGAGRDPQQWLDERDRKNGMLTLRAKRAIFDALFSQSYGR